MAEQNEKDTDPTKGQRQDEEASADESQGKRVGKGESHDSNYGQGHSTDSDDEGHPAEDEKGLDRLPVSQP